MVEGVTQLREGSEISERGVTKSALEVIREAVVSSLWFLHLQVWFSSLPTLFSSFVSSLKCIVRQPCNFVLRPWSLFSSSSIVEVCCSFVLEDIFLVGLSFPFSLSLLVEHKKFWVNPLQEIFCVR